MAKVTYAADALVPRSLDYTIEEMAEQLDLRVKPLRLRVQPDVYDVRLARYTSWAGVIWSIDVDTVDEGRKLREGLTLFFRRFGEGAAMQDWLLQVLREVAGEP